MIDVFLFIERAVLEIDDSTLHSYVTVPSPFADLLVSSFGEHPDWTYGKLVVVAERAFARRESLLSITITARGMEPIVFRPQSHSTN